MSGTARLDGARSDSVPRRLLVGLEVDHVAGTHDESPFELLVCVELPVCEGLSFTRSCTRCSDQDARREDEKEEHHRNPDDDETDPPRPLTKGSQEKQHDSIVAVGPVAVKRAGN